MAKQRDFFAGIGTGKGRSRRTGESPYKRRNECARCGNPVAHSLPSTLCADCAGTCVVCGEPTRLLKKGRGTKSYKGYAESRCPAHEWKVPVCAKCGKARDGNHHTYCISCNREYQNAWYHLHKDERRAAQQAVRKGKPRPRKRPRAPRVPLR